MALIAHLPPDSAFYRSRNQGWSEQEQLAALTAMAAFFTGRNVLAAAGVKSLPKPLDIPAPHARRERSRPRREPLTRQDWYRMLMPPKR